MNKGRLNLNFGEAFIERAICEIRYSGTLAYYEKRVSLCRALMQKKPEFRHWTVDAPLIQLHDEIKDEDRRRIFTITSHSSSLIFRNPGVYQNFQVLAEYLMRTTVQALEISRLARVGVRIFYFVGVKEEFRQLRDLLLGKILNVENIKRFIGARVTKDFSLLLDSRKGKYDLNMTIGPVSIEEITKQVKGQKYFVPAKERRASLLMDLDLFKKDCSSGEMAPILNKARSETNQVVNDVLGLVKEEI